MVELPILANVLYGLGAIQDAAEKIDHSPPPAKTVATALNAQHGAAVISMCSVATALGYRVVPFLASRQTG